MKSRPEWEMLLDEEVDAYHLRLKAEKKKNRSRKVAKRAMRFFLDTSDASVDLGSRSTRAMMKAGLHGVTESSREVAIASDVFSYTGFAINIIYTLLLPAIYIYARVSGQPIPFMSTAVRWSVSASAVALSIIALAFPPAAFAIGFVGASIVLVASAVGLVLTIQARMNAASAIQENKSAIRSVINELANIKIEYDKERLNLRAIKEKNLPEAQEKESIARLKDLSKQYSVKSNELSALRHQERELFVTYKRDHSNVQIAVASMKLMVATLLLVGLALAVNPFTAPIGIGMIAAGAVLGFTMYLAGKGQEQMIHKEQKALKPKPVMTEDNKAELTKVNLLVPVVAAKPQSDGAANSSAEVKKDIVQPASVQEPNDTPGIKSRG